MTTYVEGQAIRYPRRGDSVREPEDHLPLHTVDQVRMGKVISTDEDGCVHVYWDDGEEMGYEPDTLYLHATGWWWVAPVEESAPEGKSWG